MYPYNLPALRHIYIYIYIIIIYIILLLVVGKKWLNVLHVKSGRNQNYNCVKNIPIIKLSNGVKVRNKLIIVTWIYQVWFELTHFEAFRPAERNKMHRWKNPTNLELLECMG